ncbi:acyltransferase family protein [Actinomadura alba]|uniref:Acyltransferase family protein n=1 Tax=Actinomadura alba TaxID=406431 RepID=A0ABR7M229_9ACTN|nr:acyltransferase family protein [Actinomadura alba]MBC6471166.1 acyltransferase family protein [Actinomadura alba]
MPVPAEASPPLPVRERRSGDAPHRPRDPYFDNVKFLAVVLVVVGHAWGPLRGMRLRDTAHLFVYTFHMPLFIVIAGHFSRRFAVKQGKVRGLIVGVAVPYLIFEAAYPLYVSLLGGAPFVWSPLSPYYLTWFLLALFAWRLSTPLWQQLRWPLAVAVLISLISGAVRLPDPVVTRTLGFLPFFVIGLLLTEDHFRLLRTRPARVAAVLVAAAAAVAAVLAAPHVDPEWVGYRYPDERLGVSPLVAFGGRAVVLVCGLVMTAAFLALVPARRTWFTELGSASMYVYLLHGFVVLGATYAGWYSLVRELGAVGALTVVTVLGAALAPVLAGRPVRRVFRWVVEPRLDWAFRH